MLSWRSKGWDSYYEGRNVGNYGIMESSRYLSNKFGSYLR